MKKKVIQVFLMLSVLTVFSFVSYAKEIGFTVEMVVDKAVVNQGDTFTVEIYATNISAPDGILSVDIPLTYDSTALTLVSQNPVFPSVWDHPEQYLASTDGECVIRLLNDIMGEKDLEAGASEDKEVGYKLTFKVETPNSIDTSISISEEGLLCTNAKNLLDYSGVPTSTVVALNPKENSSSEESQEGDLSMGEADSSQYEESIDNNSSDNSYEPDNSDAHSSEKPMDSSETSNESAYEDISEMSSGISSENSSSVDEPMGSSESTIDTSDETDSVLSNESQLSDSDESEDGGLGIVLYIIIGCVAIAAGAFAYFFFKNKRESDDMNPVNPS